MGNDEIAFPEDKLTVVKNVEVERARRVAWVTLCMASLALKRLQLLEQVAG